jgi:hypothetical protein
VKQHQSASSRLHRMQPRFLLLLLLLAAQKHLLAAEGCIPRR